MGGTKLRFPNCETAPHHSGIWHITHKAIHLHMLSFPCFYAFLFAPIDLSMAGDEVWSAPLYKNASPHNMYFESLGPKAFAHRLGFPNYQSQQTWWSASAKLSNTQWGACGLSTAHLFRHPTSRVPHIFIPYPFVTIFNVATHDKIVPKRLQTFITGWQAGLAMHVVCSTKTCGHLYLKQ
jgi:hypothetical protein